MNTLIITRSKNSATPIRFAILDETSKLLNEVEFALNEDPSDCPPWYWLLEVTSHGAGLNGVFISELEVRGWYIAQEDYQTWSYVYQHQHPDQPNGTNASPHGALMDIIDIEIKLIMDQQ